MNNEAAMTSRDPREARKLERQRLARARVKGARTHWQFYVMILLPVAYVIVFSYMPMAGVLMAFQRFSPIKGFWKSPWVGLYYFEQFLSSPSSVKIILNTLFIGIYSLLAGFPIPIMLAIAMNEIGSRHFKKTVQMVTYAPYFISTVVMVGIIFQLTDLRLGVINNVVAGLGGKRVNFMSEPQLFSSIYVWSNIWQTMGYSSIIYFAALSGIDSEVQEAAIVDGASRLRRIWHVDMPAIRSQVTIMLIMSISGILNVGFEKVLLMQNPMNMSASEVISTFTYKVGLVNGDYGFSTAVGLFNSVIGITLLLLANFLAKKVVQTSLF